MEHPIDDDPPDDRHCQAGHDEQDFLDEWGHFYATNVRGEIMKLVEVTRDPTLGTRARHRQRGKVGDCATGRLLAAR